MLTALILIFCQRPQVTNTVHRLDVIVRIQFAAQHLYDLRQYCLIYGYHSALRPQFIHQGLFLEHNAFILHQIAQQALLQTVEPHFLPRDTVLPSIKVKYIIIYFHNMFADDAPAAARANRLKPADRAEAEISLTALKLCPDLRFEDRYVKRLGDAVRDSPLPKLRRIRLPVI